MVSLLEQIWTQMLAIYTLQEWLLAHEFSMILKNHHFNLKQVTYHSQLSSMWGHQELALTMQDALSSFIAQEIIL